MWAAPWRRPPRTAPPSRPPICATGLPGRARCSGRGRHLRPARPFHHSRRVAAAKRMRVRVREIGFQGRPVVPQLPSATLRSIGRAAPGPHLTPATAARIARWHWRPQVRHEGHHQGCVVQQQRVGRHVVGAQRFPVKVARVHAAARRRGRSSTMLPAIVCTPRPCTRRSSDKPLRHQLGVALALNHQVA